MVDFASQPADYGTLIAAGQATAPNPIAGQTALVNLQNQQLVGAQVQQQMAMQRLALQRQLAFGQELGNYVKNPSAQGLATLFGKYPEFDKQAMDARGALDRGDITQLGSAAALAAKGQYSDAAKVMQERVDAEKASGGDPSHAQMVVDLLNSGDPAKQKAALGMLSLGVGIAVGPDKAAEYLKANGLSSEPLALGMDQRLVSQQGQTIVGANPKLENVTNPVTGESTGFNPYTGKYGAAAAGGTAAPTAEGGGQASGVGGGMQASVAHVLSNEGGYNPKDANGSPTNFGINFKANAGVLKGMGITAANFKNMTQDQAAQIYASKYWPQSGAEKLPPAMQAPYFDVYVRSPKIAKMAMAQSGGDPQKFMQIANSAFQSMASNPNSGTAPYKQAWATRDAGNMALVAGSAPVQGSAQTGAPAPVSDPYHFGTSGLNTKEAPPGYAWNATHTAVVPIPGSTEDPNSYSPQEIDDLARNWIATGPTAFASLGGGSMGGGGIAQLKKAALARATQMMAQAGITADQLPALRSKYNALNTSMNQNTQILNMLEASERAIHSNAQQVLQTQQQLVKDNVINNGSPFQNNANLELWSHIGSPEVKAHIKAYEDSVNGLAQEYTKFMNSANGMGGNAAPSDAARGLALDLNDTGQGPVTMARHIKQIFIETGNKRNGIQAQNEAIQSKLSSLISGPPQQQANALPAGAKVIGTYKGRRVIEVNGQRLVEQ
jgi:hypothetical protein